MLNQKFYLVTIILLILTLTSLACIPCSLFGGQEKAAPPVAVATTAATTTTKPAATPTETAQQPTATALQVPEAQKAASPVQTVTLGEEHRSQEGGFVFRTIPGYTLEGEGGMLGMNAPGADPELGPSIMFLSYPAEQATTNEQLLAEWRQELEADIQMSPGREVMVGGLAGLVVDINSEVDNGQVVTGRLLVAVAPPMHKFTMMAAAPSERWNKEVAPLFEAVVASVSFFEPTSAADEAAIAQTSAGDTIGGAGGEIRQWAVSATASSEYGRYSRTASEATGAPNTLECGEMNTAWQSEGSDTVDWLQLTYATPVRPTQVNIIQTNAPNQVLWVDLIDPQGEMHQIYLGEPKAKTACPYTLSIPVEQADYVAVGMKIVIDQSVLIDWNAIDAVELVGYAEQAGAPAIPPSPGENQAGTESHAGIGDIPAGGFYYEVSGEKMAKIAGSTEEHSSYAEYGIAMVEQGAGAQYSVTIYLPHDVVPGQIGLKPFDKSALAYGPSAAAYTGGAWFYYATGGTVTVEAVGDNAITASFEMTAAREDDVTKVITVKGAFNQAPLVKK